jgi:hypothetical protein
MESDKIIWKNNIIQCFHNFNCTIKLIKLILQLL